MSIRVFAAALCVTALLLPQKLQAADKTLSLQETLRRVLAVNPRLTAAERDIGMATGRRIQAGALPNPEVSAEVDNILGSGAYRGTQSAETSLQLGQLVELGGKRDARIAIGSAGIEVAQWQRAALRLEILSETASAYFTALGAQRRIEVLGVQITGIDRLTPLLQRRVEAGASSPAETARSVVAGDLVKAERERARVSLNSSRREIASLMGLSSPDFGALRGDLSRIASPPPFRAILSTIEGNPQLVRWTALRAQRDAELLAARLKAVPDIRVSGGWRHYRDTNDDAVRLSVAVPIPVFDRNTGGIIEAQEARGKADAERNAARAALTLTLGRAYETLSGSVREIEILRSSAIPNARQAIELVEAGYGEGRYSLLEVLDAQTTLASASLREIEALISFHTAVAVLEGLTGMPVVFGQRGRNQQ